MAAERHRQWLRLPCSPSDSACFSNARSKKHRMCQKLQQRTHEFVRKNSGPIQPRCERRREIPTVGGTIADARAGISAAAEVIYPWLSPLRAEWGWIAMSAEQFRRTAATSRLEAERFRTAARHSGRKRSNSEERRQHSGYRQDRCERCRKIRDSGGGVQSPVQSIACPGGVDQDAGGGAQSPVNSIASSRGDDRDAAGWIQCAVV